MSGVDPGRPVLVTGGAGFIGSAVVRHLVEERGRRVVNVDRLTYAASPEAVAAVEGHPAYRFEQVDVCDRDALRDVFERHAPGAVIHLAAESHVDRSIDGPADFVRTNLLGTFTLLEESRRQWERLGGAARDGFRFVHVSTDEVYGSLGETGRFDEGTAYDPSSPYSATKAGADHLARAWHRTYGLPTVVTNCSNNYGPFQFPEKLIPLIILNAIEGADLPVYGRGENVRDWLHVHDHARALVDVLDRGRPGATYLIGARQERRNLDVVRAICRLVDELVEPLDPPRTERIRFVADRPGHDLRYAIDPTRIETELGWQARYSLEDGLRETVRWYLAHRPWWETLRRRGYRGERLGLAAASPPASGSP